MGDLHSGYLVKSGEVHPPEKVCMQNIAEPLNEYLKQSPNQETFVVESGMIPIQDWMAHLTIDFFNKKLNSYSWYKKIQDIVKKRSIDNHKNMDPFASPLIMRLNMLNSTLLHDEQKLLMAAYPNCSLKQNVTITPYDLRSNKYCAGLFCGLMTAANSKSPEWIQKLITEYFKLFIEQFNGSYNKEFKSHIEEAKKELVSELNEIQKSFTQTDVKAQSLNERIFLFYCKCADLGFLASIGKALKNGQNITLYTGAAHSKELLKKLQDYGYEIIFEKDSQLYNTEIKDLESIKKLEKSFEGFSTEDYETFFTCEEKTEQKNSFMEVIKEMSEENNEILLSKL